MPLANPFERRRCPFCNNEIRLSDCAVISNVHPGEVLHYPPPKGIQRLLSGFWINSLDGPQYTQELASRQCPVCGNPLPFNIEEVDSLTIAIIGDIFSGKSHYIAAAIKELKEWETNQTKRYIRFIGLSRRSEEQYINDYYRNLFERKSVLPATQPAHEPVRSPLIYEMVIQGKLLWQSSKRVNIIIYDSSGEDISFQERMVQYSQYVLNSSGIIFLADPLAMPNIAGHLPDHLRPAFLSHRRPSDVLNSVLQTFERNSKLEAGKRLSIPIAIMLSKCDLLKYLFPMSQGQMYRFLQRPNHSDKINLEDWQVVDHEVRQLIAEFGDRGLLQISDRFAKVNFFATSATGYAPDIQGIFPAVEPLRCTDPLLWILRELHVIEDI